MVPTGSPSGQLVLGGDLGGTSTRLVIAAQDGRLRALARGGPGNPNAVGAPTAAAELASTFRRCLDAARAEAAEIGSAVLGLAGISSLGEPDGFLAAGLPGLDSDRIRLVPDAVVAFASGTPEADGYVVVSGTGAGAMQIASGMVAARRDGWGWLLGDAGSAFWLGREAVRSTLSSLQRGDIPGPLGREVLARTESRDLASLIGAVHDRAPVALAELATAVSAHAEQDPEAAGIVARAAEVLLDALVGLDPQPGRPVVLTGSVLAEAGPVRTSLLEVVRARLDNPVCSADSGLAGALWLALRRGSAEPGSTADHPNLLRAVRAATPAEGPRVFAVRCG